MYILYYVILCYVMLCYVMLCYVMLRSIILYFIVSKVIYIVAKQLDKNYNETKRAVFYKLY